MLRVERRTPDSESRHCAFVSRVVGVRQMTGSPNRRDLDPSHGAVMMLASELYHRNTLFSCLLAEHHTLLTTTAETESPLYRIVVIICNLRSIQLCSPAVVCLQEHIAIQNEMSSPE